MQDILNLDYINSLPQPFIAYFIGDRDFKYGWPVEDICVETGIIRIDVCGLSETKSIGDVNVFVDGDGNRHEPDTFFIEETELEENIMEESNKHKWYDVIVAWASGEKIQVRGSDEFTLVYNEPPNKEWKDFNGNSPDWAGIEWEWRIKPKVVTKKYRMALFNDGTVKVVQPTTFILESQFVRWVSDIVEVEVNCD